jgi:hypothetical protein
VEAGRSFETLVEMERLSNKCSTDPVIVAGSNDRESHWNFELFRPVYGDAAAFVKKDL